ncbi:alpha/beta-hydrolase [Thozetella sp. PMI_491]|nr:alpha/beta-hydrolase [Thozetella sp. PMI_491]
MPLPLQVGYRPIGKPEVGVNGYVEPTPGRSEVLPKGWSDNNGRALDSDIRIDHDVEVRVRDGVKLYMDIYRPAGAEKVPAIISWSPYGKKYSAVDMIFNVCVWKCCLKPSDVSGLEKFEGVDPAWWVAHGYATVHVDSRGVGQSGGQVPIMGMQDAEDCYDVIEAVAKMDWCDGNVGMAGNSYLAIIQWHVAQLQPPSLKAIAPWEGCGDLFREQFVRGGWFTMSNMDLIDTLIIKGGSGVEDQSIMYERSPVSNIYWEDKRPDMKKVNIPTFMAGSDFSNIHTMGAVRAWMEVPHEDKWIKWNGYQEWFDLYALPESYEELKKFFDRYLKGIQNDWESTPKVRWTSLQFGDRAPIHDIILPDFPVPNTEYKTLYLDSNSALSPQAPSAVATSSHNSEDRFAYSAFTYTFPQDTRIIGIPKAVLYMSSPAQDDFITFVLLRKLDKNGKLLYHLQFPIDRTPLQSIDDIAEKDKQSLTLHMGSMGILRASRRKTDPSRSIHSNFPFHPHDEIQLVPAGEVVRLEIGIWAMGNDFDAGESIQVQIHGQYPSFNETSAFSKPRPESEKNHGEHIVHFGGDYQSHVILPIVPR